MKAGDTVSLEIRFAYDKLEEVKVLFNEYTATLGVDLAFQNYAAEIANLPGEYALPNGRLYIAVYNDDLAGCIALRPYDGKCCEMKRLFVRPQFRGLNIGYALVESIIADAENMEYDCMVLDTLPSMKSAIMLYKKFGFFEIEPYRYNPVMGAIYMQLNFPRKKSNFPSSKKACIPQINRTICDDL